MELVGTAEGEDPAEAVPPPASPMPRHHGSLSSSTTVQKLLEDRVQALEAENATLKKRLAEFEQVKSGRQRARSVGTPRVRNTALALRDAQAVHDAEKQQPELRATRAELQLERTQSTQLGHWECEVGGGMVPFDAGISAILTDGFQRREFAVFERDCFECRVDFSGAKGKTAEEGL